MTDLLGGIPVAPGGTPGALVTGPGQLQYGEMLLGGGTSAGWRELVGWRDVTGIVSDSPKAQANGTTPGSVLSDAITVTYTFMLRGTPDEKAAALAAIERYAPMDGVERMLAVNDANDGVWFRMARLTQRAIPQNKSFQVGPLECSLQWVCADPARYNLAQFSGSAALAAAIGGLTYPLTYPLNYGTASSGSLVASNAGSASTPLVATFTGPLVDPVLSCPDWRMAFAITLAAGETLVVDTAAGTALLNGDANRLFTIKTYSDPIDKCRLKPGTTSLSLAAASGTGTCQVTYRDARL